MTSKAVARRLREVKQAIREPYAWPGGYPLYVVMGDGEAMSINAAKENWREICRATLADGRTGWEVFSVEINWEDGDLYCCQSGARIESAYAEPEDC